MKCCGGSCSMSGWVALVAGVALGAGVVVSALRPLATTSQVAQVASAAASASGADDNTDSGILKAGAKAPDWNLQDPDGKVHNLRDYAGDVVLLDFWATWCGPCKKIMPSIQKIHEKYKDSKRVHVFGVNAWERGDAKKFMTENKYTYGLLLRGDDVAKAYGVSGIPALFLIGPDGKIIDSEVGLPRDTAKFEKDMAAKIDKALQAKAN